ncbi:MAG: PilZ domain-containing protein [Deltaproteobacteria bacterium]
MTIRIPSRNRRGMLRLAYPGHLRGTLLHRDAEYGLIDLSQEGARAVVPSAQDAYRVGGRHSVVLCLVSGVVLVTDAEVTRIRPGEVAFRFCGHFAFGIMLEEHCAVLAGEGATGVERSA